MGNLSLSAGIPAVDETQITNAQTMSTANTSSPITSITAPASFTTNTGSAHYLTGVRLASVLLSLTLGKFLVAIDISLIAVAIPKISTEVKALEQIGWYGSAYLLTVTALQPSAGKMYKFYDIKSVHLSSIIVFEG